MQFNLKNSFDLKKKLGPPYWAWNDIIGPGLAFWVRLNLRYIKLGLEKRLDYLTELGLILLKI